MYVTWKLSSPLSAAFFGLGGGWGRLFCGLGSVGGGSRFVPEFAGGGTLSGASDSGIVSSRRWWPGPGEGWADLGVEHITGGGGTCGTEGEIFDFLKRKDGISG